MRAYHITLAEDDPDALFLMHTLLAPAFPNSRISTFSNPEDALKHILDVGTDILITDHGMGSMPGTELIRQLRDRGLQTPIIMISGDPRAEEQAHAAGANQFLLKKADTKELEHHIRRLLPSENTIA
jgi:DNA-binding NarL/FixJ family response regulator